MKKRIVKHHKKHMAIKNYIAENKYNILAIALVVIVFTTAYIVSTEQGKKLLGIEVNPLSSFASEPKLRNSTDPVPGQYIIVFNTRTAGDPVNQVNRLSNQYGGQTKKVFNGLLKGYVATLSPEQAQAISEDPQVQYVEQDSIFHETADQINPPSWGLDRIDQENLPRDNKYSYGYTGAGINAYIVDGGIRTSHIDFGGRATSDADFVNIDCPGTGNSGTGHGTHVASTVGGNSYGVAKAVRLHSIRVTNCSGNAQTSSIIDALQWVQQNRVEPAVVNISLNGPISSALDTAVNSLVSSGVGVVVAAGNSHENACDTSPARASSAITVGAVGQSDAVWDSVVSGSNFGPCVDINAPGVDIVGAHNTTDAAVIARTGTSMAAPHVTGVMALYMQRYPNVPVSNIEAAMKSEASPVLTGISSGTPNLLVYSNPSGTSNTKGPKINILAPTDGTLLSPGNTAIQVTAEGRAGGSNKITSVEILLDGISQAICSGNTNLLNCTRSVFVYNISPGQHTITAKATDNAPVPRTTTSQITITKPSKLPPVQ